MKRFLVLIVALVILPFYASGADKINEISFSHNLVGVSRGSESVVPLDMKCAAGIILSLSVDGTDSDNFTTYIYDNDIDGNSTNQAWYSDSDRDDNTNLIYSYPSSDTSWKDTDPIPFSCDDATEITSLYVAGYNHDASTSLTLNGKILYRCYKNTDYGNDAE